jgi:hypothetical protein
MWSRRRGDSENVFVAALNRYYFFKICWIQKNQKAFLYDSSVSEPTESQYHDRENSLTEVPYAFAMRGASPKPLQCSICVFRANTESFR